MSETTSALAGVNVLLEGPTGTGKTHAIGTLVDSGVEVFYLALESGFEALRGYYLDRGKPIPPNLHWHVMDLVPKGGGFADLMKAAKDIGDMTQDSLYKLQDFEKGKRNHFYSLLSVLANFEDQRTGEKFGGVDTWGPNRALVIDGLTGLGKCAMNMVIGNKPVRSQTDWGIAQDQVENLIRRICDGCKCHFILLSHIERETDLVQGGSKITVSTLGVKLAPKIPPMFSDVILAVRVGDKFTWSTANSQADLKTRNLPIAENIPPSFNSIMEKWKARGGRFSSIVQESQPQEPIAK